MTMPMLIEAELVDDTKDGNIPEMALERLNPLLFPSEYALLFGHPQMSTQLTTLLVLDASERDRGSNLT